MAAAYEDPSRGWLVRFRFPPGRQGREYKYTCENEDEARSKAQKIETLVRQLTDPSVPASMRAIPPGVDNIGRWIFTGGTEGIKAERMQESSLTLGDAKEKYLSFYKGRVGDRKGDIAIGTYIIESRSMEAFVAFAGASKQIAEVARAATLDAHITYLRSKTQSCHTMLRRVLPVRRFLLWGWERDLFSNLPKNLNKYASIPTETPDPKFYGPPEIDRLFAASDSRQRLFLLLGLNCGYTSVDISSLEHGHVDWETGIVTRFRHKTVRHKIPQVSRLWPATLAALKEHASTAAAPDSLILVKQNGAPLV